MNAHQVDVDLDQRRAARLFVEQHGTENQRERSLIDKLPTDELLLLARSVLFAPFSNFPRYEKIDADEVRHERGCRGGKVTFETREPDALSADEWSRFKAITLAVSQANQTPLLADNGVTATVKMVEHVGSCHSCAAEVFERSASITMTWAGHRLAREYTLRSP